MAGTVHVNPAAADHLVLSGVPGSVTAGTPFSVTVTARDFYGNVATSFGGTVSLTGSGGGTLINGQNTFSVTLFTAGFQSITASSGGVSSSTAFLTVDPAPASHFSVVPAANPVNAGSAFNVTVTALDPYGNRATTAGTVYTGTVHFTSSDPSPTLPADYHFVVGDNGAHTFSGVILRTSGNRTVTATDTISSITGFGIVTVNPGPATHFGINAPPTAFVGLPFNITVTALDQFDNQATTSGTAYTGTLHFTSSDSGAVLPADYTFVTGDNGAHNFGVTLNTISTQSVTATDIAQNTITGSTNITVRPP